jgi:hypothetical protein
MVTKNYPDEYKYPQCILFGDCRCPQCPLKEKCPYETFNKAHDESIEIVLKDIKDYYESIIRGASSI